MFNKKAVLILGAGASAPFRYPIGASLIANIIEGLRYLPSSLDDQLSGFAIEMRDFLANPYAALVSNVFALTPPGLPREYYGGVRAWKDLADHLDHIASGSIDDFARNNPSLQKVIKLLVATEIARWTYEPDSMREGRLRTWAGLTANARATWYGKLIARLQTQFPTPEAFQNKPKTSVITFNYDRSFEIFLDRVWNRSERFSGMKWQDAFSVLHVHGELQFPENDGHSLHKVFTESIFAAADAFLMIGDERHKDDPAMIARAMLHEAGHIVTIGFDFHIANVELLNLDMHAHGVRALNYFGSKGFDSRAARTGVPDQSVWRTSGRYEIAAAIDDGLFDF